MIFMTHFFVTSSSLIGRWSSVRHTGEPDFETGHMISTRHWSGMILSFMQAEYSRLAISWIQTGASYHRSGPTPLAPGDVHLLLRQAQASGGAARGASVRLSMIVLRPN